MNRNRVNKKRMGRARVLSRAAAGMLAAALCFQPMTALAGPAGDSSLTSSSSNAGPGGGSAEKPVGLVYVGIDSAAYSKVIRLTLGRGYKEEREYIRYVASSHALNLALKAAKRK